jgi:hypothetical protein
MPIVGHVTFEVKAKSKKEAESVALMGDYCNIYNPKLAGQRRLLEEDVVFNPDGRYEGIIKVLSAERE